MAAGYWVAHAVAAGLARALFGWRVDGREHIPATGGFIVAANHIAYADPPLIGAAAPRRLAYMAKRELFGVPLLSGLIRSLGAFPIRRQGLDRQALREAARFLAAGSGLLVFPAGTRQRGSEPLPGRPGVSLLAAQAGVPVVPTRIEGSAALWRALWRRRRLRIRFGAPLPPPSSGGDGTERQDLRAYTTRLMEAIEALADDATRTPGSGSPGSSPD
ncbi:MAG: lysophospholipid acyltransferase family protein [Candidatus Eiseniibacteriota bacterium]|jgi:1-acyl-sn-glycerol-3-phosphate acyltransferase